MAQVRCTIELCVYLMQLYFEYGSARKCHKTFQCKFPGETVPSKQYIHYLVSELKNEISSRQRVREGKTCAGTRGIGRHGTNMKLHKEYLLNE